MSRIVLSEMLPEFTGPDFNLERVSEHRYQMTANWPISELLGDLFGEPEIVMIGDLESGLVQLEYQRGPDSWVVIENFSLEADIVGASIIIDIVKDTCSRGGLDSIYDACFVEGMYDYPHLSLVPSIKLNHKGGISEIRNSHGK